MELKTSEFVNAVDNPKGLKDIKNLLIGCLKKGDKSSTGIVSLINNDNGEITKYDRKKLEAITTFFGCSVENIEQKTIKLTTVIAIEFMKN